MTEINEHEFNLAQIADSGQCFRMDKNENDKYIVIHKDQILELYQRGDSVILNCSSDEYNSLWKNYFDLEFDYGEIISKIKSFNDEYLCNAVEYGYGIRILRQDPWEMLISFIISQQMRIPRIKQLINNLSASYGTIIEKNIYSFPTPMQLADTSENELKNLGFGYRSKYISDAAKAIADKKIDLQKPFLFDSAEACEYLKKLRGVGDKVANCIALFAYHKTDAFPVDVWIKKIINEQYGGNFDRGRFCGYAGIVQQYMFYWERHRKNK